MTRLLIIGSSHVGAYKNAMPAFAQIHPDVQIDFFGVRAPLFYTGKIDEAGVFVPQPRDDADRAFVVQTNGKDRIDTRGYDHLILIGHRFAFHDVLTLLERADILEGHRAGRAGLISELCFREIVLASVQAAAGDAARAVADHDGPVTFIPAPYPAQSILERGDGYQMARLVGGFWPRPDAAWVMQTWQDALIAALATHGHAYMPQADDLCAAPYATKSHYAARAAQLGTDTPLKTDHRHMNADYGLAMLRTLVETHLTTPTSDLPQREDA